MGLGDPNSNPTSFSEVETDGLGLSVRGGYMIQANTMVYTSLGVSRLEVETTSTCPADTNVCNPAQDNSSYGADATIEVVQQTFELGAAYKF